MMEQLFIIDCVASQSMEVMHLVVSVHPSIGPAALLCPESVQERGTTPITSLRCLSVCVCLCVCNQWSYADNRTDAVNRLLISHIVSYSLVDIGPKMA